MKIKNSFLFRNHEMISLQLSGLPKIKQIINTYMVLATLVLFSFTSPLDAQPLPVLPLDFESGSTNYTFLDFDGGLCTKIANSHSGGINTSANIGQMIKNAGQVWAGSLLSLASPIDFSVNKSFKVKVFMPRVGAKLLLKVENAANSAINYEKEVACTVANSWEELTFDYSAIDATKDYQNMVFIFDNGTMGDGTANFTYFFDDVKLVAGTQMLQMNLPVSFDLPNVNYWVIGFGGAENSSIVEDPVLSTNKCAKVVRAAGSEIWAGTSVTAVNGTVQTGFASKVPFTATEKRINVRVFCPAAGLNIRLKVEDYLDPTKSVETETSTTVANAWETLTFNFANNASGTPPLDLSLNYNKLSIFFNFGVSGATAGEQTFYFDDIRFGSATSVQDGTEMPNVFSLSQNYPNPFNPTTKIEYTLPNSGQVKLQVFTITGELVKTLIDENQNAGIYSVDFSITNLPSGTYMYRLSAYNTSIVKKMLYLK